MTKKGDCKYIKIDLNKRSVCVYFTAMNCMAII